MKARVVALITSAAVLAVPAASLAATHSAKPLHCKKGYVAKRYRNTKTGKYYMHCVKRPSR